MNMILTFLTFNKWYFSLFFEKCIIPLNITVTHFMILKKSNMIELYQVIFVLNYIEKIIVC